MTHIKAQEFADNYPAFLTREDKSQTFSQQFSGLFTGDANEPASQGTITVAQANAFAGAAEKADCVSLEYVDSNVTFTGKKARSTVADFVAGNVEWGYFISSGLGAYVTFYDKSQIAATIVGVVAAFVAGYVNKEQAAPAIKDMYALPGGTCNNIGHILKVVSSICFGTVVGGGLMPTALSGQVEAFLQTLAPTLPLSELPVLSTVLLNVVAGPAVLGFSGFVGWSTGRLLTRLGRLLSKSPTGKLKDAFSTLSLEEQAKIVAILEGEGGTSKAWDSRIGFQGSDFLYGGISVLLGVLCTSTSIEMIRNNVFKVAQMWAPFLPFLEYGKFTMPVMGLMVSPASLVLSVIGIMAAYMPYVRQGGHDFMLMLKDLCRKDLPGSLAGMCVVGSLAGDAFTLVVSLIGVLTIGGNAAMLAAIGLGAGMSNHCFVGKVVAHALTRWYHDVTVEVLEEKLSEMAKQISIVMLTQNKIDALVGKEGDLSDTNKAHLIALRREKAEAEFALKELRDQFPVPTVLERDATKRELSEQFAGLIATASEATDPSFPVLAAPTTPAPTAPAPAVDITPQTSWFRAFVNSLTGGCCARRHTRLALRPAV